MSKQFIVDDDGTMERQRFKSEANLQPLLSLDTLEEDQLREMDKKSEGVVGVTNINKTEYSESDVNSQYDSKSLFKAPKSQHAQSIVTFDVPDLPVRHNFESRLTPYRWPLVFFFAFNITAISCMSLSMSPQSAD